MRTMDVKKLAGVLIAFSLAVLIIRTATPGTLAVIDVGLIGLLYVIRSRRTSENISARVRKELFEAVHRRHAHAPSRASISSR